MSSKEWTPYIAAWRQRRHQAAVALAARIEAGRMAAQECARVLVEDFGAKRVWLFGSLVHQRRPHAGSDIDLAVEGLPALEYFPALTALWNLLPPAFELNLVPLEDAQPSLAGFVREQGELLFCQAPRDD